MTGIGVSSDRISKFAGSLALVLVANACGSPMTGADEPTSSASQEVAGDCGYSSTCSQYSSCTSWDLNYQGDGVGYTVQTYAQAGDETFYECETPGFGCTGDPDADCQAQADTLRSQLIAQRSGISPSALAGFSVTETSVQIGYDQSGCGPYDEYCDQEWAFSCTLTITNLPNPETGRHPWCGCAAYTAVSCLPAAVVVGGRADTCAMVQGGVQCWGANDVGQLGNNTAPTGSFTRVTPNGLASGVYTATAGGQHTCAIVSGSVTCWGDNSNGQLGDGKDPNIEGSSGVPVGVVRVSDAQEISAGEVHTCGIFAGNVWCWGSNGNGQLGNGNLNVSNTSTPGMITGIANAQAIASGGSHSCAIVGGAALCWGSAAQLGNGQLGDSAAPVQVTGLTSGVTAISAGFQHTCAIVGTGVECWGANDSGQLGDGTTTARPRPVPVSGLTTGVLAIASGQSHTCALLNTGAMQCWGGNSLGQLGINSGNTPILTPTNVFGLTSGVQAIYAGYQHSCAIVNGSLECWGNNHDGEVGFNPSNGQFSSPRTIPGLSCTVTGSNPGCR